MATLAGQEQFLKIICLTWLVFLLKMSTKGSGFTGLLKKLKIIANTQMLNSNSRDQESDSLGLKGPLVGPTFLID